MKPSLCWLGIHEWNHWQETKRYYNNFGIGLKSTKKELVNVVESCKSGRLKAFSVKKCKE